MEKIASEMGQKTPTLRVVFAGFIWTAIEFYDFYLYGLVAALVNIRLRYSVSSP
jgi:hypothetical protein